MSQQNNFGSGFILGSIIGGVVGGLIGTALANQGEKQALDQDDSILEGSEAMSFSSNESIELARHSLEDKIAQLNLAIDDVRQQLGSVQSDNSLEQD